MSLGNRLKLLRKECKKTQKEVASTIGIKDHTLSQYENGWRKPDYKIIASLAKIYRVSIDYLITDSVESEIDEHDNYEIRMYTESIIELRNTVKKMTVFYNNKDITNNEYLLYKSRLVELFSEYQKRKKDVSFIQYFDEIEVAVNILLEPYNHKSEVDNEDDVS